MAVKERKLDIFQLLEQIDRKERRLWEVLSDEQRKEFSPLMTLRWMCGTTDARQLKWLNKLVNPYVFELGDQKEALLGQMIACGSGSKKRYTWPPYKQGSSRKNPLTIQLIRDHYRMSPSEAEDALRLFSTEELFELADEQGWQKDEIAALKKELK